MDATTKTQLIAALATEHVLVDANVSGDIVTATAHDLDSDGALRISWEDDHSRDCMTWVSLDDVESFEVQ